MSKMSKTIAILGVVAGLGVAALPLSSYAVEDITDTTTTSGSTRVTEASGDKKVTSAETNVKLTVNSTLWIETPNHGTDNYLMLNQDDTNMYQYKSDALAVKVFTNNNQGYQLNIQAADTALKNGTSYTIPAQSGGIASAAELATGPATASSWGYTVSGSDAVGAFADGKYAGVTTDGETIATKTAATGADGNTTNVTFGAVLQSNQESGDYVGVVTFTASDLPVAGAGA